MPLLEVNNLSIGFAANGKFAPVVEGLDFHLNRGEILGIVGESGSGKTVTSLSILRLLPQPSGKILSGKILYNDLDLVSLPREQLQHIRGSKIAMIFQEPMTALNPVRTVGAQIFEVYQLHFPRLKIDEIKNKSIEIFKKVGIPDSESRLNSYPHQLSGGMRQRVMIAMALAIEPEILIADEPTTALDVTIQAQILRLIKELQEQNQMSVIFVTHDLGVIAELCDRVVVMYAGEIVEFANVYKLFSNPSHPYTQGLIRSIPRLENPPKKHLATIEGIVPAPKDYPKGCRFGDRCHLRDKERCFKKPEVVDLGKGHFSRCFFAK